MGRRGQGYGSEDNFIEYRTKHCQLLDSRIQSILPNPGELAWLYPRQSARNEPKDLTFISMSEEQLRLWHGFWPKRGNRSWDGVARCNEEWLLFEAKANAAELFSPGTGASTGSLKQIIDAFDEAKRYLAVPAETVWQQSYYQYANRIAVLYFLNIIAKIPARLVFLYFVGDVFPDGRACPQNEPEWRPLISQCHSVLKLPHSHQLSDRIHELFVPAVRCLSGRGAVSVP
jgi:hypothetical protein